MTDTSSHQVMHGRHSGNDPDTHDDADEQSNVVQSARLHRVDDGDVALQRDDCQNSNRRRVAGGLYVVIQLAHRLYSQRDTVSPSTGQHSHVAASLCHNHTNYIHLATGENKNS